MPGVPRPLASETMTPDALRAELAAVERERDVLKAERAKLAARLEVAAASERAARIARDAALRTSVWGGPKAPPDPAINAGSRAVAPAAPPRRPAPPRRLATNNPARSTRPPR
jgi:hypothetical protein